MHNLFEKVIDDRMDDMGLSEGYILNALDRAVGAAATAKRRALFRLICPWYWVIDIPAFVLRIPFLILRQAGLPASMEHTIWAHAIKLAILVGFLSYAAAKGLDITLADLLALLAK